MDHLQRPFLPTMLAFVYWGRNNERRRLVRSELNWTLISFLAEKRETLIKHKQRPTRESVQGLPTARNKSERTARCCANDVWSYPASGWHGGHTWNVLEDKASHKTGTMQNSWKPKLERPSQTSWSKSRNEWSINYSRFCFHDSSISETAWEVFRLWTNWTYPQP